MNKVLVADDKPPALDSLIAVMQKQHPEWLLYSAGSVAEAKSLISSNLFDAVVTDWIFDETDKTAPSGRDILVAARERDAFTMVIVMTVHEDEFDKYKDAFNLGAFDCISKAKPGSSANKEIILKTNAALKLRELHLKASLYSRHIDSRVSEMYDRKPEALKFEKKLTTICFCDMRGFSALNKLLLAHNQLVSEFLAEFYELTVEATHKFDGIVDKFIGDGAMLLFGSLTDPSTIKDDGDGDALNAVKAALFISDNLQVSLTNFKRKFQRAVPAQVVNLEIGIGIHTAEVLVGLIKTRERDQYTALGHDVNLTQRFESAAGRQKTDKTQIGNILISGTVKERVEEKVVLKDEGILTDLKNLPEPMRAWSVVRLKEVTFKKSLDI